jgi:hypothetical protein
LVCGLCNKRVCLKTGAKGCHIDLQNDSMFGLTKCDFRELMGGDPGKWSAANVMAKSHNKTWVDKLRAKWMKEDQVD